MAAGSLVGLTTRPAQDVELILSGDAGRRVKRRYTIRSARPDLGEIDVDALLHGAGPGSEWAAAASVGAEVELLGPRGKLELRPAGSHLFIGDESAVPAFASIIAALPPGEDALAVVEVAGPTDELPLGAPTRWVHREGVPAGRPDLLTAAVRALPASIGTSRTGTSRAYLLGETRAMIALRPVLHELGVADEAIFVKGYWNLGRAGRPRPA